MNGGPMPEHPEDIDQLGPFYKRRFEELSDSPESDVKSSLFEKMDMLEGKRPKTVYLHFNVFGMKVAASLTMVIVSSLALVAVAAVTLLTVRNNTRAPKSPSEEIIPLEEPNLSPSKTSGSKKQLQVDTLETPLPQTSSESVEQKEQQEKTNIEREQQTVAPPAKPELPNAPPADKNGDNSRLLKELEEDELFKDK